MEVEPSDQNTFRWKFLEVRKFLLVFKKIDDFWAVLDIN
jgi:hypothetical protein